MLATNPLPIAETIRPTTQAEVAAVVRSSFDSSTPLYPFGGQTALDYGFTSTRSGAGLDIAGLNRVVEYTPRDMTILVEAGIRMADLASLVMAENQQLPIDVPRAAEATLGGVVATNWTGPRRYGYGTIRDYVIGIHAVDGRGIAFQGGGRVVKNVAGYDFCKLLCGSLGTLAVITQVALKLKPIPETSATLVAACPDLATTDILLNRFVNLAAPPVAIDYLAGAGWNIPISIRNPQSEVRTDTPHLVIRVEGSDADTNFLADQVQYELWQGGGMNVARLAPADAEALWLQQIEFAGCHSVPSLSRGGLAVNTTDNSPLAIKIAVPPSAVTKIIAALYAHDPNCTVQAHAASGILIVRFATFKPADVTKFLVGKLRPLAIQHGGSLIVLSTSLEGFTPHIIWGNRTEATVLAERVKQKFDPRNILNPDRFAYH
ncbi:MAG: FAD-binding oxidoreductase [Pirellulales bacterium]